MRQYPDAIDVADIQAWFKLHAVCPMPGPGMMMPFSSSLGDIMEDIVVDFHDNEMYFRRTNIFLCQLMPLGRVGCEWKRHLFRQILWACSINDSGVGFDVGHTIIAVPNWYMAGQVGFMAKESLYGGVVIPFCDFVPLELDKQAYTPEGARERLRLIQTINANVLRRMFIYEIRARLRAAGYPRKE